MPDHGAGGGIKMAINAWKDGETIINEENMNAFLSLQPFQLIYDGTQRVAKTGVGVVENDIASHSYCSRFVLTGSKEISRVELEIDRDGAGADLIVQIRHGMSPATGVDGTLLKQVAVPKEFIPDPKGWWSIPIELSGLTSGGQYWLVVLRGGDATNHNDWIGENTTDASYPSYRRVGGSGNWTTNNALHFKIFSGASGELIHGIYGDGHTTIEYDGELISKIYRYLPPADTHEGGVRDIMTFNWAGEYLKGGDV